MKDIALITADSVRYDYVDDMPFVASLDVNRGAAAGHYTRPSIASLLSSQYAAAAGSQPVTPTLPEVLSNAGYTSIGFPPSPQLDPAFGFAAGFDIYDNYYEAGSRGNTLRDTLSESRTLRRVYHRLFPPHAKLTGLPTDVEVATRAIGAFNAAQPPRFVWIHLNDAHRPYGRGERAISEELDRKALFDPSGLTDEERKTIERKYKNALGRVDETIAAVIDGLESDNLLAVITSDHGDEFGEDGAYFHQPQRRRVTQQLVEVPVAFQGADVPACRLSLVDIAPTIAHSAGISSPSSWDGVNLFDAERTETLTFAPWNGTTTVLWQDFDRRIVMADATVNVGGAEAADSGPVDVPADVKANLRDLGYVQ